MVDGRNAAARRRWTGPGHPDFDPATVDPLDWTVLGAGVLAFVFSLFGYYTYPRGGALLSAWHGLFGWFAAVCAVAGSAVVAVASFVPSVRWPAPPRLLALAAYTVATVCVVIAAFVGPSWLGVVSGRGFAFWLSLLVIVVGLAVSGLRLLGSGVPEA